MSKEYAVYDMNDYEQCVRIGTMKEIAEFLNCSSDSIWSYISHKKAGRREGLIHRRYDVVQVVDDEEEKEIAVKTNAEIFEELINVFRIPKVQYEIFDEFKWQLKGLKDKVIVDEEWKKIKDFHYSLSNYGRVRNDLNKKIKNPRFHRWILQVDIYENGKRYTVNIKRLVAEYFIRHIKDNEKVITKDGDIRNNYYKNLEIVSK